MSISVILDSADESRQIVELQKLNSSLLCNSHGAVDVAPGVTDALIKVFNAASNPEIVLLACRALNTVLDISPNVAKGRLILEVVPKLCQKLLNIDDIDVAEACAKCLSLVTVEHPRAVLEKGGLRALTAFFEFFPNHIQNVALSTCVNLCGGVGRREDCAHVLAVVDFLTSGLMLEDDEGPRKVTQCICRIVENMSKPSALNLPPRAVEASGPVKSGDADKEAGSGELWRMGFLQQLASKGLVAAFIRILGENSPKWSAASQVQIMKCLGLLVEGCPSLLTQFFEHGGVALLKRLLVDYVDPLKNAEAGLTAAPGYISAILRLATSILPSPDATMPIGKAQNRKKPPAPRPVCVKKEKSSTGSSDSGKEKEIARPVETPPAPSSASPASKSGGSGPSSEWACSLCTFLNLNTSLLACEMCGTLNPSRSPALIAIKAAMAAASSAQADGDTGGAPSVLDFDLESIEVTSILEVYADNPHYYEVYAQDLLLPIFRLALQTSVPGVSRLVFTILATLRRHHVETLANAQMAPNVCTILFQNIVSPDRQDKARALDLGASLLAQVPEHYKESMLRQGILSEVVNLHQLHHGGPTSPREAQSGGAAAQHSRQTKRPAGKAAKQAGGEGGPSSPVSQDSAAIVVATTKFLQAMRAMDGGAGMAMENEEQGAAGKRKKRPDEEMVIVPPASETESDICKRLRGLVQTTKAFAHSEASAGSSGGRGAEKRQRDARGRAVTSTETGDYAALLEPFQALASLITSPQGVTVFELTESGMIDGLVDFLLSAVKPPSESKPDATGQRDRIVDLYAFVAAFSECGEAPTDMMEVEGSAPRPAIATLVDLLQATLNAMDGLPATRHGKEGPENRYRSLLRPFRLRVKDKSHLLAQSSGSSALGGSGVAHQAVFSSSCGVEPLVTVGHLTQHLEKQARQVCLQALQSEAARAKPPVPPSISASGASSAAKGGAAAKPAASGSGSSSGPSSSLARRTAIKLEIDTAAKVESKKPTLRRSPRVDKASPHDKDPAPSTSTKPPTRKASPPPAPEPKGTVSSRTRSHVPTDGEGAATETKRSRAASASSDVSGGAGPEKPEKPEKRASRRSLSKDPASSTSDASSSTGGKAKGKAAAPPATSDKPPRAPQQKGRSSSRSAAAKGEVAAKEQQDDRSHGSAGEASYGLRSKRVEGPEPAKHGDKVYAAFTVRGRRIYYEGKVTAVTIDDKLDVRFEDGEQRYDLDREALVRKLPPNAVPYAKVKRELQGAKPQAAPPSAPPPARGSKRAASDAKPTGASRSASFGGARSAQEDKKKQRMLSDDDDSDDEDPGCDLKPLAVAMGGVSSASGPSAGARRAHMTSYEMLVQGHDPVSEAMRVALRGGGLSGPSGLERAHLPPPMRAQLAQRSGDFRSSGLLLPLLRRLMRGMVRPSDDSRMQAAQGSDAFPGGGRLVPKDGFPAEPEGYSLDFRRAHRDALLQALTGATGKAPQPAPALSHGLMHPSMSSAALASRPLVVSNLRLCLDGVSVSLSAVPQDLTVLELVQFMLWARGKTPQELAAMPGGHRTVTIDDRQWTEVLSVDYDVQDASSSTATGGNGKARAAVRTEPIPAIASASVEAKEAGVQVLPLRSAPLSAAVLCRALERREGGQGKGAAHHSWLESNIESKPLRDTLRLLRLLLLLSRDMERLSRSGPSTGSPVEQELQSKCKSVDWSKVAAACMIKSLSRKFAAQFEDLVGVVAQSWPDWCDVVASEYAELLPLDVRIKYFQGTALSRSRVIEKAQEQVKLASTFQRESLGGGSVQSRLSTIMPKDIMNRFGTLKRIKMVLPRDNLLETAIQEFKKYAEGARHLEGDDEDHDHDHEHEHEHEHIHHGDDEEDEEEEGLQVMFAGPGAHDDHDMEEDEEEEALAAAEQRARARRPPPRMGLAGRAPAAAQEGAGGGEHEEDEEGSEGGDMGHESDGSDDDDGHPYMHHGGYGGFGGGGLVFMESYGDSQLERPFREASLQVDFEGETGHGNGPTQEFYTLICREVMKTGMGLWRGDEGTSSPVEETNGGQSYLNVGTGGLFPSVAPPKSGKHSKGGSGSSAGHRGSSGSNQKPKARLDLFRFLGRFIGKALQDERLLDLPLSPVLCKLLLGHPLTLHDVAAVDPVLGRSLLEMQRMANGTHKGGKLKEYLEALHLDFTLPGAHWYELKAGGSDELVTCERVHEYLDLVTRHLLVDSVRESVDAVRAGIEDVMPLAALRCFGPEELQQLLCGGHEEDWRAETIGRSLVCKHGYTRSSPQIQQLISLLANFTTEQRKQFLMFITGTPRLPIGGFSALHPNLTVVRKELPVQGRGRPDDYLPSCSTCQVYLKLPQYSSEAIMRQKLLQAMTLGQEHFAMD